MKISVTRKHIDHGIRGDCFGCPLAGAFQDVGFDVMIEPAAVDFYDSEGGIAGSLPLPDEAQYFIIAFDRGEPVRPFVFEMPGLTSDLRSLSSDFVPVAVT